MGVQAARRDERSKARAAAGSASTNVTGPLGDTSTAPTTAKKLTGQ